MVEINWFYVDKVTHQDVAFSVAAQVNGDERMLLSPLSPAETIEWFEALDRQHEILCFMITANPAHRKILGELAQNFVDADTALGSRVAFALFGGNDVRQLPEVVWHPGGRSFLPGQPILPRRVRDYSWPPCFEGESDRRRPERLSEFDLRNLGERSAEVSLEWLELLGVKRESLPALCVLIKGSDTAVIALSDSVNTADVLRIFGRLADIVERDDAPPTLPSLESMREAIQQSKEVEDLERRLQSQFDAMCNKFKATADVKVRIAEFLAQRNYSAEAYGGLLSTWPFASTEGFDQDSTVKGIRNKLDKLRTYRGPEPREEWLTTVADELTRLRKRREETAQLVQALSAGGFNAKLVKRETLGARYDKYAARANSMATLLEKLAKLFGLAKGLHVITELLK